MPRASCADAALRGGRPCRQNGHHGTLHHHPASLSLAVSLACHLRDRRSSSSCIMLLLLLVSVDDSTSRRKAVAGLSRDGCLLARDHSPVPEPGTPFSLAPLGRALPPIHPPPRFRPRCLCAHQQAAWTLKPSLMASRWAATPPATPRPHTRTTHAAAHTTTSNHYHHH